MNYFLIYAALYKYNDCAYFLSILWRLFCAEEIFDASPPLRQGTFTYVRWQITLCNPKWQATTCSSEMGFPYSTIYTHFYSMTHDISVVSISLHVKVTKALVHLTTWLVVTRSLQTVGLHGKDRCRPWPLCHVPCAHIQHHPLGVPRYYAIVTTIICNCNL